MIGIYNHVNNQSGGKEEGTLVTASNRVTFTLNSTLQEEKEQVLAIRTLEDIHKTIGDTVISLTGENKNKWALSLDGG